MNAPCPHRFTSNAPVLAAFAGIACLLLNPDAKAVTNNVSSIAALQAVIDGAAAGDVIVLANGSYTNSTISLSQNDIIVRAATAGGVFLNGSNTISVTADRTTLSGFQFTSGANSGIPIQVTGSQNLLTQLNFDGYWSQKYINIQAPSQSNVVEFCNFRNKPADAPIGNLIHCGADDSVVGYHKIRFCSFQDMPGAGGDNGNECIRLSNGAQSSYFGSTVVEYCYFNNTGGGDSEAISVKCRGNLLRYNTFTNNPNAMMVFRNGNDNVGYGNFFLSAGGIRVKEANNIYCYNNYFENSGVGGTMNAVTYDYVAPNLNNINFIHNTFVQCGSIDLSSGATNNTWANNLFKKNSGSIFTGSASGISWAGNIYTNTLGITIPSGMTKADPKLVINSDGYYGLASNSPAIDAASSNYPPILNITNVDDDAALTLDISGQARPALATLKDVGCDEYGVNGTLNRPLGLSDVGPSFLGGPQLPVITTQPQSQSASVGSPVAFFIVATNTPRLSFQWQQDGTNISGATGTNYSIASAQSSDAGNYTVIVSSVVGSVTSVVAALTLNLPPGIATHPQSQTVSVGTPVTFFVVASNAASLAYQWRKDGSNIPEATGTNYVIAAAQPTDAGDYTVVVTNVAGSVTSSVATLTVLTPVSIPILDDHWLDGTRTNTLLPSNSAWYASSAASLTAAPNSLNGLADSSSARSWWTYFTTNPAAPVQLNASESLQITLSFILNGVNANNTSRGLRLGVFDSSNGSRTLADGASPSGTNIAGYMLGLNMGQTFGGSPTLELWVRTNLPSANLMGTTGDYASLGSGGPVAGSPGFSNGIPYTLRLAFKRNTNSLDVTVTISNTNGWSITQTSTATNSVVSAFDTFDIRPATSALSAMNFAFTGLKVEKIILSSLPVIASDPASLSVNAGAYASFAVAAGGNAPLSYQWRYNDADLPGATAASYAIASAQSTNAGGYSVVVTNMSGGVSSAVATLTVVVSPPQVTSALSDLTGSFTASGIGPTGEVYRVLATSNLSLPLTNWAGVDSGVFTGGVFMFTDTQATNYPQRFYRIVTP